MGADYIVDDDSEKIKVKIWDYDSDEFGTRFAKEIEIDPNRFEKGRMRLEVEGAKVR